MWDHVWHETLNPLAFLERSALFIPIKPPWSTKTGVIPMASSTLG